MEGGGGNEGENPDAQDPTPEQVSDNPVEPEPAQVSETVEPPPPDEEKPGTPAAQPDALTSQPGTPKEKSEKQKSKTGTGTESKGKKKIVAPKKPKQPWVVKKEPCRHDFCNPPKSKPSYYPKGLPWASGRLKCLPGYCADFKEETEQEIVAKARKAEDEERNYRNQLEKCRRKQHQAKVNEAKEEIAFFMKLLYLTNDRNLVENFKKKVEKYKAKKQPDPSKGSTTEKEPSKDQDAKEETEADDGPDDAAAPTPKGEASETAEEAAKAAGEGEATGPEVEKAPAEEPVPAEEQTNFDPQPNQALSEPAPEAPAEPEQAAPPSEPIEVPPLDDAPADPDEQPPPVQ